MSNNQKMLSAAMHHLKHAGGHATTQSLLDAGQAVNTSSPKKQNLLGLLAPLADKGDIVFNGDGTVSTRGYNKFVNSELVAELDDFTVKMASKLDLCTTEVERILMAYIPAQYG